MAFMKGPAPWRRTLKYLDQGSLVFKDKVKIMSINYHETLPESDGLRRFIFWNLAPIQYKNPKVQCLQIKNVAKTPYITFYLQDQGENKYNKVLVNCYKREDKEIYNWCRKLFGKTEEQLRIESAVNQADFNTLERYCMCQMPGQVSCPTFKRLPEFMRGKYRTNKKEQLDEIRKTRSDEESLKIYWETEKYFEREEVKRHVEQGNTE